MVSKHFTDTYLQFVTSRPGSPVLKPKPIAARPKTLSPNDVNGAAKESASAPQEAPSVISVLEEKASGM